MCVSVYTLYPSLVPVCMYGYLCAYLFWKVVYLRVYALVSEPVCLIGVYKHTETQAVESGQAS